MITVMDRVILALDHVTLLFRYVEAVSSHSKLLEDRKERSLSLSTMMYEDKVRRYLYSLTFSQSILEMKLEVHDCFLRGLYVGVKNNMSLKETLWIVCLCLS